MLEVDMPKLPDAVYDKLPPDAPGNGDIVGYNLPRGYKTFSCSSQLSMKLKLLINIKLAKFNGILRLKSSKLVMYPAHNC